MGAKGKLLEMLFLNPILFVKGKNSLLFVSGSVEKHYKPCGLTLMISMWVNLDVVTQLDPKYHWRKGFLSWKRVFSKLAR